MTIKWENLPAGEHDLLIPGKAGIVEAKLNIPEANETSLIPKALAICCHPHPLFGGAMNNKVVHTITKTFTRMGMVSLRFNFRGVGKSEGKHDKGIGESEDLLELCRLINKSWPEQELWLAGFSFGSWVSVSCAREAGAEQLLSIAPPVQYFNFNIEQLPDCPWLVLMGEDDDIVEPESVFKWVDSQPNPPELIKFPETGHFFHGEIARMSNILKQHYGAILNGNI